MELALKAYGETGILAYGLSESERLGLIHALTGEMPPGCLEYIWGDDTLCFVFKHSAPVDELAAWLKNVDEEKDDRAKAEIRNVAVVYDGPDLASVAEHTGLTVDEVIGIHSSPIYTVRMMGFTPGFPYLDGLDDRLQLPRRGSPRKRIEPGAVAIGGPHAGIYSVASPGGWHLLGRTPPQLFDADAARGTTPDPRKVFLLSLGDRLKFQPST